MNPESRSRALYRQFQNWCVASVFPSRMNTDVTAIDLFNQEARLSALLAAKRRGVLVIPCIPPQDIDVLISEAQEAVLLGRRAALATFQFARGRTVSPDVPPRSMDK